MPMDTTRERTTALFPEPPRWTRERCRQAALSVADLLPRTES